MPTVETNVRPTEQELVELWRATELERAGYPPAAAPSWRLAPTSICTTPSSCCKRAALPSSPSRSSVSSQHDTNLVHRRGPGRPVVRTCLTCADARLHPEPAHRRRPSRPADAPHVRADAAVAILACYRADRAALGGAGRRVGARPRVAVWGVAFGVVGARLYHDLTSWSEVPTPKWQGIFEVWKGGLGVWGGIRSARSSARGRPPLRRERRRLPRRGGARPAARAGRSAASATGGTRSSTASRRRCRGRSRSMPRTGRCSTSTAPPSTRRSSTS